MTAATLSPTARSFVARKLEALGAAIGACGGPAVAMTVPGGTPDTLRHLGIVDLSPLPRVGFKGRGTIPAMQAAGLVVEAQSNRAFRQADGGLCAVLAPGEIVLLSGLSADPALVERVGGSWSLDDARDTYLVPRASTHAWFRIAGEAAPAMFAKLCAIDLRPHKFPQLAIAQTSVAKLTGIIIREDLGGTPAFHLLADSAAAEYVWDCVLDAMNEFGGRPAGLSALRELAGSHEAGEENPPRRG